MIKIENVSFKYKNSENILENVNMEIKEGEFVAIIGKNGTGKSTLAKLIAGITKPSKGKIYVDDIDTKNKEEFISLRKKVGIVFQNPENQIIFNNVTDDIAFSLKTLGIGEQETRIKSALEKVDMEKYINSETYELSLGQKQRITIAGVLSINPKYIVFDEPTTMIDSKGKEDIYKIILELKKQGYTIIYVTNAVDEILMADRIIIINQKGIASEIKKEEITEKVEELNKNGIELPKILQAVLELNKNGIKVELKKWTMKELIEKIIEENKK